MTKQIIAALGVLIILIVSQIIWFNSVWQLDKVQHQKEIFGMCGFLGKPSERVRAVIYILLLQSKPQIATRAVSTTKFALAAMLI